MTDKRTGHFVYHDDMKKWWDEIDALKAENAALREGQGVTVKPLGEPWTPVSAGCSTTITPLSVGEAAKIVLDDSERIGCQRSPAPALNWRAAYDAMGKDYKECGWGDWPSILDAALRALADKEDT